MHLAWIVRSDCLHNTLNPQIPKPLHLKIQIKKSVLARLRRALSARGRRRRRYSSGLPPGLQFRIEGLGSRGLGPWGSGTFIGSLVGLGGGLWGGRCPSQKVPGEPPYNSPNRIDQVRRIRQNWIILVSL